MSFWDFDFLHDGIADFDDTFTDSFMDIDHNGIPDVNDSFIDLDHNGIPYAHDSFLDLDHNGIPYNGYSQYFNNINFPNPFKNI